MGLKLVDEFLNGLKLFEPQLYQDQRGFFMETFRADEFEKFGLPIYFPQDNHSGSFKNTFRGLHFQWDKPQGKLIRVIHGSADFFEVDIRANSPTKGQHVKLTLSAENKKILWVPPGFANGFLATSDWCEVFYKCSAIYNPNSEQTIRWNSPELNINLHCKNPILSEKDSKAITFNEWMQSEIAKTEWYKTNN